MSYRNIDILSSVLPNCNIEHLNPADQIQIKIYYIKMKNSEDAVV
jgi:hypothetical protein